jgi:hypothetical protein
VITQYVHHVVEHARDLVVDVFGAVVGMEAVDSEGELRQQGFQCGQHEGLADAFDGDDDFPLGDLIGGERLSDERRYVGKQ